MPEAVPELQGQLLGERSQNLPNQCFRTVKGPPKNLSLLRGHPSPSSGLTPCHPVIWGWQGPRATGTELGFPQRGPWGNFGEGLLVRGFWLQPEAWALAPSRGLGGTLQSTQSTGDNRTLTEAEGTGQSWVGPHTNAEEQGGSAEVILPP